MTWWDAANVNDTVLPWIGAGLTALGFVEPIAGLVARVGGRTLFERFEDLQKTAAALRDLGPNRGPHAAPDAEAAHRRQLDIIDDESRLVLAEHARRTQRRPGSLSSAVIGWGYGALLAILGWRVLTDSDAQSSPSALITVAILWVGAFCLGVYGSFGARRRWTTRALRIAAGVRDQYTTAGMQYSWRRVKRLGRRRTVMRRARIVFRDSTSADYLGSSEGVAGPAGTNSEVPAEPVR
jgi:hypothetical protein